MIIFSATKFATVNLDPTRLAVVFTTRLLHLHLALEITELLDDEIAHVLGGELLGRADHERMELHHLVLQRQRHENRHALLRRIR